MSQQRGLLLLIICAVLSVSGGYASTIQEPARQHASASYGAPALHMPSAPDDWLGGTGNWSNGADWSAGLPGSDSDVSINTGSDNVTLDTSSSINSLVLGGATGSSMLTGDGNARTLAITGALTVNQSGNLYLSVDTVTAGASSTNLGSIDLENRSSLQVNGNFNNSGALCAGCNGNNSSGNALIAGTLTNTGTMQLGYFNLDPYSSGYGSATVGGLVNTGSINLTYGGIQVNGNATNAGGISPSIGVRDSRSVAT